MFVKICGLTNLDDTLAAIDAGAQALGFNFVRISPRYIAPDELAAWIDRVPAHVWKVGVFANETPQWIEQQARALGLDIAQLHGNETPAETPAGLRVWKAARVTAGFDPAALDAFDIEALLLDGPASGTPFDWSIAALQTRKLILAGGLDATNVAEAIARVRPWGVDVCSRIESAPGRKDHAAMRRFIQTVMSC
jgi:phosphoribosylanthranilate isomerase